MNRKLYLIVPLLLGAMLGGCVPDDIYWLADNRHFIAMRDRPMLIDSQTGDEWPVALPGLEDEKDVYFTATPDLRRLAAFTDEGIIIFDQRAARDDSASKLDSDSGKRPPIEFLRRRKLAGAGFGFGKFLSPTGAKVISMQESEGNSIVLSVWDIQSGQRRDLTRYIDNDFDIALQAYWLDEDRIAVMFMREMEERTDTSALFNVLGHCILHDLTTETTRTLAADMRLHTDAMLLETLVPDVDNGRLIVANENRITFVDVESGAQRHLYPYRMLEGEWPLYFAAVAGPRYNAGIDMMTFSGMERPDGGANIFEIDLGRTEELPLNPYPWLTQEKRNVRATAAVPLTHFRQMGAFYASTSPRGDKLAYFVNAGNRPGIIVQRGQRPELILSDSRDARLKMIADLNDKRDRLFTTMDDATRANDWAEWAVKVINDGLADEDTKD